MDIGVVMSRDMFEDKLECARDGKSPETTWSTRRLPKALTPGWTNRLFVAVEGRWLGYFPLSGDVLWNPEDAGAPYALIFDTRRWTPIPPTPAPRFRSWTYMVPALDGEDEGPIVFHKIWIEPCDGARRIRERYGLEKALGYLIGEKLLNFLRAAGHDAKFAQELPRLVAEIKRIFSRAEIQNYLENIRRVGALAHVCTDEEYEVFRAARAIPGDPVRSAEEVLLVERIKELLAEEEPTGSPER